MTILTRRVEWVAKKHAPAGPLLTAAFMKEIMIKENILAHLKEAKTELDQMIEEVRNDSDFDFDGYYVAMQHIYHHLNTAWNSRNQSKERIEAESTDDFNTWRLFPRDFDLNS